MKYNGLGTSGLFVSELSFGTMTFGESYPALGGLTQTDASTLVAKAFEAGVNLFDTADVHHIESIVSPVVVDRRKCSRPASAAFRSFRATRLLAAEQATCEWSPDQQANCFAFQ
jgi:hypothetical protein